jgi:hypothetical protein
MNTETSSQPNMRPFDLVLYLFGYRGAIERVAAARFAWLIGALLVLTAGIARNYDHLDLLREPEWFIGPFAASMVSVGFIFIWLYGTLNLRKVGGFWRQFGTFLVLAWLTAPCAWLYAIPIEAMTDIVTATKWNIAFLAIVAFWRVAIIVRAVSVLTGVRWFRALPLVLAPAAIEAMIGSFFEGLSLVGIMGGIRLPPETQLLVQAAGFTSVVSFWLMIICIIASFIVRGVANQSLYRNTSAASKSVFSLSVLILIAWSILAMIIRPQIANRYHLKELIEAHNYEGAIAFASGKTREDFPRHHYLPPEPKSWFPFQLLVLLPPDAPAWLREEWVNNAIESLKMRSHLNQEDWEKISKLYPEIPRAIELHAEELRSRKDTLEFNDEHWLRIHDAEYDKSE